MTRPMTNLRATNRTLSQLRRQERLSELGEALAHQLVTPAVLVDSVTAPGSGVRVYAGTGAIRNQGQLLAQMALLADGPENDSFSALLAEIASPGAGSTGLQPT
jgi:hypothetical protein